MPEHETDPRGGKRTIPARMGLERSFDLYVALVAAALALLVAFVVSGGLPWLALLGLISVPPLVKSIRVVLPAGRNVITFEAKFGQRRTVVPPTGTAGST